METSREQQLQQLQQPLQLFVLPLLPANALAGLRGTCRLLQGLVDDDIGSSWHEAASCLVPRKCLHGAHDGFAVQQVLRGQGRLSSVLTSGQASTASKTNCIGHSKLLSCLDMLQAYIHTSSIPPASLLPGNFWHRSPSCGVREWHSR